jgi:hypothetical protein
VNVQTRAVVRAVTLATVAVFATVLLVACTEDTTGVPTVVESSSSLASTVNSSEMTSSSNTTGLAASDNRRPSGPPVEARAACDGLTAEAACSFTSPRDGSAVDGTCHAHRDDASQLACRPNDWPGRGERGEGPGGPPEEALTACESVETGAACSFDSPFGSVTGTCRTGRDGTSLVCAPTDWPGR